MDIIDNVVPYISGEEDKIETEARKILGKLNTGATAVEEQGSLRISAACNRVPVMDGHTACVSLRFVKRPPPSAAECKKAMISYVSEAQKLSCPSAPEPSIHVFDEPDRPQPRLDRDLSRGYTVSVGRVREDDSGIFDLKFVALSHNSKLVNLLVGKCKVLMLNSCNWGCWIFYFERRSGCSEGVYMRHILSQILAIFFKILKIF